MTDGYFLTIEDSLVTPAIELIRKTLDPSVSTPPHVVIRGADARSRTGSPPLFESAVVRRLWLTGPGTFDESVTDRRNRRSLRTLWLGCWSDALERIAYVPAVRSFEFPLSLYEGPASTLAWNAYHLLSDIEWGFSVRLDATAVARQWDPPESSNQSSGMSRAAALLFTRLTARDFTGEDSVRRLTSDQRLALVEACASHISSQASRSPDDYQQLSSLKVRGSRRDTQPPLWHNGTSEVGYDIATPPEIAQEVVETALALHGEGAIDFGDPALGRGRFFAELVSQAGSRLDSARGIEIDRRLARFAASLWTEEGLEVTHGDFLGITLNSDRSLVVANPPYQRSQDLSSVAAGEWRAAIAQDLGLAVSPRSDLYVYFILHAHAWMKHGAIAAWLIPSEFKFTLYGATLREYLTNSIQLERIHTYDHKSSLFADARVTSTVLLFRNCTPSSRHRIRFTSGGSLAHPMYTTMLTVGELHGLTRWPLGAAAIASVGAVASEAITLGDLFETKRGIATGANQYFVLTDEQRIQLEVPDRFVIPVLPKSRDLPGPVVYAKRDGSPDLRSPHWLLSIDAKIETLEVDHPRLYEYLKSAMQAIGHRRIVSSRALFARQETRPHTPFLFGYMSRGETSLPFFLNRSRATYLNNYIGLYPRFDLRLAAATGIDDIQILAMLRELGHDEVVQRGRIYADGLRKIEPRELRTLVLPDRMGIASTLRDITASEGMR